MDYDKFQKALKHLELQHHNLRHLGSEHSALMQEAVAESVIRRFETCYDVLWKTLKRHIVDVLGLPNVPNSPKPVFRLAGENDLLPSPVENWMDYTQARIDTSHDYSGDKASDAIRRMDGFIRDAAELYCAISGKPWE